MIILLHGTNQLAIDERLHQLRTEHDPSGINTTTIEHAAERIGDLRSASLASGFFGTTRLVIAQGLLDDRPTGRGRRGASASSRDEAMSLLSEIPASTVLALLASSITPTEARALQRGVPDLCVETFDVPRGRDLVRWVCERAAAEGAQIADASATQLLEALFPVGWRSVARRDDQPPDLYRLSGEISKLATAAGPGGTISADLIADLVPGAEGANMWGLSDAITAGDPSAAVREIERALAGGTPAEALIGQLAAQFETLAAIAAAGPVGISAVAAETGLTEGRLQQAIRNARRFSTERIRHALAALRMVDVATKQGETDAEDLLVGVVARLTDAS